jgi:hypothetical protein
MHYINALRPQIRHALIKWSFDGHFISSVSWNNQKENKIKLKTYEIRWLER